MTGWFLRLPDGSKYSGTWDLGKDSPYGRRANNLFKKIYQLAVKYDMLDKDLRIAVEQPMLGQNAAGQVLGLYLSGAVNMWCDTYNFLPPKVLSVAEWRGAFLKANGFLEITKPPLEVSKAKKGSEWYKAKVIEQCQRFGFDPENDNEADAFGIGWWLYSGGPDRQEENKQAKVDKKRKKKAKALAEKQEKLDNPELQL